MEVRFRKLYWVVAVIFLLVTLAEAGFFTDAEGIVVGKKTFRIWGVPTHSQLIIKYQEPLGMETGRLVVRYKRVPVTWPDKNNTLQDNIWKDPSEFLLFGGIHRKCIGYTQIHP